MKHHVAQRNCPTVSGIAPLRGYPLVVSTRLRQSTRRDGATPVWRPWLEPRKLPENAVTPTTIAPALFRGSAARRRSRAAGRCWAAHCLIFDNHCPYLTQWLEAPSRWTIGERLVFNKSNSGRHKVLSQRVIKKNETGTNGLFLVIW